MSDNLVRCESCGREFTGDAHERQSAAENKSEAVDTQAADRAAVSIQAAFRGAMTRRRRRDANSES